MNHTHVQRCSDAPSGPQAAMPGSLETTGQGASSRGIQDGERDAALEPHRCCREPLGGRRLERILASLPAGVVVLDGAGYVQQCNPAAEELLGVPLWGALWREVIARAFAPRIDDGHEVSLRDGRRVSIATRALGDEPGQVLLIKDVTETRRLQDRLNHHERLMALGEMSACVAHQIRTPLSTALLYASHLNGEDLPALEGRRFAGKVLASLQHLERLVKHMLIFARAGNFACESIGLACLLGEFAATMEGLLVEAGGHLEIYNGAPAARVVGNREALLGALQNLAANALQVRGRGCELRLSLLPAGETACDLILADNGPGIPGELQERVFEPFFTTRPRGTGLGLSVVRAIARAHDGAVWVDSPAGGGCRFTLRLPRAVAQADTGKGDAARWVA